MEIFKNVKGYEGSYQISNFGNVKSLKCNNEKILKLSNKTDDYFRVNFHMKGIKQKCLYPHRLVAEMFVPNPFNKKEVNHKNGIKSDNYFENLEWCSSSENQNHSYKTGLQIPKKGEECHFHILKEKEVVEIRSQYVYRKVTMLMLSIKYNVHITTIQSVLNRTNWKHI